MNVLRIGAIRDDIGEQLIRALGIQNQAIQLNDSAYSLARMLERDRLDAIAYAEDIAKYQFKLAGVDLSDYETVYVLGSSHTGYAFHKSTDPRVLEPLRKALDELRADGTVDRIHARYLNQALLRKQGK